MTDGSHNITGGTMSGPEKTGEKESLRDNAETLLQSRQPVEQDGQDLATLIHELQVHQIELELQNEELRRAQLQLQASQNRYFQLYHHAPVGYLILGRNGVIRQANGTFAAMVNQDISALTNVPFTFFLVADERRVFLGRLGAFFRKPGNKTIETRMTSPGGSGIRHIHLAAVRPPDQEGAGEGEEELLVSVIDITARANAEEKLRQSRDFFLAVVDTLPLCLAVLDGNGQITVSNAGWRQDCDRLLSESILPPASENYFTICQQLPCREDDRLLLVEGAHKVLAGKTNSLSLEIPLNPAQPWGWLKATLVRLDLGRQGQAVVIHQNISERKRLEEEERHRQVTGVQMEKLDSLGVMTGAITHHYNNLLAIIQPNLEMLGNHVRYGEAREMLDDALAATSRATELTRRMLSFMVQPRPVGPGSDLSTLARERLQCFSQGRDERLSLLLDSPSQGPMVRISAGELAQVIDSLLTNGWEAMAGQGTIRVQVSSMLLRNHPPGHLFPPDWQPDGNEYGCITIMDTGTGIKESKFTRLFDPFFSTKFTGRGLGLSITLGLVRSCRGCITVASRQDGSGSIFSVYLPLVQQAKN